MTRPTILPEHHDAGFIDVVVEYKRGEPKADWPPMVRITPVPSTKATALMLEAGSKADPILFYKPCVLPHLATDEFLNRLTPECIGVLIDVAFEMTFGAGKKKAMEEIAQRALRAMNLPHSGPEPSSPLAASPGAN